MDAASESETGVEPELSLDEIVAGEERRRRRRLLAWLVAVLVLVGAGVATWWWLRPGPAELRARFEFETLERGSVAREVVATGRVEARGTVDVGAEISGRVVAVEADHGDRVEAGQVLVRFDAESLDAQIAQAKASVASAKAALAQAKVSLLEAERREEQSHKLHSQGYESHENFEAAKSATELARAQVETAAATLAAQRASYELTKTQATKAVIESPIDGVIISRQIDPGQTVAASFQTPILFVIAEDLTRMEVVTPIDEADVDEVEAGQRAIFTVDAYPDKPFEAEVVELRNEAKITQNVVTYDAILVVDNPKLELRPGMTASVRIETARVDDVLRLPNAALRFMVPDPELSAVVEASDPSEPGRGGARPAPGAWTLVDGELRRVEVELGVANGRYTAMQSGALEPGAEVIIELTEVGREAYGALARDAKDSRPSGGGGKPHP